MSRMNQPRQLALAEQRGVDTSPDHDPYEVEGEARDTRMAMSQGGDFLPMNSPWRNTSNSSAKPVPPPGYYAEAAKGHQQGVLSGMQMSPREHLDALKKHTGALDVTLVDHDRGEGTQHEVSVYSPAGTSYLGWEGKNPTEGGQPGEVAMIRSQSPGHASAMFNTMSRIAAEHPSEVSMPMHSTSRSTQGHEWVPKMQRRAGEKVW